MGQLHDYQLEGMFREFLDDVYETAEICGLYYSPSRALAEVDPVAYRCDFSIWLDSQLTDGILFKHSDGTIHDEEEETDDEQSRSL